MLFRKAKVTLVYGMFAIFDFMRNLDEPLAYSFFVNRTDADSVLVDQILVRRYFLKSALPTRPVLCHLRYFTVENWKSIHPGLVYWL